MAELKIGGNDVSKIYYKDKDVSGKFQLESGTVLYHDDTNAMIHLQNAGDSWENIKTIHLKLHNRNSTSNVYLTQTINIESLPLSLALNGVSPTLNLSKVVSNGKNFLKSETTLGNSKLEVTVP